MPRQMKSLVLIISLVLVPMIAQATADGPDQYQVRSDDPLPVYQAPDSTSVQLTLLPGRSFGLKNLGCQGQLSYGDWVKLSAAQKQAARDQVWCQVQTSDGSGWVRARYLAEYNPPPAPSFDCAQGTAKVEAEICTNPTLRQMDLLLQEVYLKSLYRATSLDAGAAQAAADLRAHQRGWIKGRNDCWKAGPDDLTSCIADQYSRRTAWLQARWTLIPPRKSVEFRCADNAATFTVSFYPTLYQASAAVDVGDQRRIYVQGPSASGAKYNGEYGSFIWFKGREALYRQDQNRTDWTCREVPQ